MYPIKMKEFKELLDGRAYISTDNKVYRIEAMTEVENIQEDVRKYFYRTLKEMDSAFKRSYEDLLEKQTTAKLDGHREGFKAGFSLIDNLPNKWKLGQTTDTTFSVIRDEIIYAKQIKKRNSVMKIPNSLAHKFYAKKIEIKISYDQKIHSGKGYGFNPHFHMNLPLDENGLLRDDFDFDMHSWELCLGDMQGKDFSPEALLEIEKELKTINLDSAYGGLATVQAKKLFDKGIADNRTKDLIWDTSQRS